MKDALYLIPVEDRNPPGLKKHLEAHPEVRFVSLTGVDLGGNDTDEKIPVGHFLAHAGEYLAGGVQTDGSSVVLPGIATLNDGKVDLVADHAVRQVEKDLIRKTLARTRGNRTRAAKILQIGVRTLQRKIKEYDLP